MTFGGSYNDDFGYPKRQRRSELLIRWVTGSVVCPNCNTEAVYVQPTDMMSLGECGSCHQFTIKVKQEPR